MKKPTPDTAKPRKYLTRMMVCPHVNTEIVKHSHRDALIQNCAVYSDGTYYCFGCGARGKVDA